MRLQMKILWGLILVACVTWLSVDWFSHDRILGLEYKHMQEQARTMAAVLRSANRLDKQKQPAEGVSERQVLADQASIHREPEVLSQLLRELGSHISIEYRFFQLEMADDHDDSARNRAIIHFHSNTLSSEYVEPLATARKHGFFYYAEPLRIGLDCIHCHAEKDNELVLGPDQEHLLGILEIRISLQEILSNIKQEQINGFLYDVTLLIFLAVLLYFISYKMLMDRVEGLQRQLEVFDEDALKDKVSTRGNDELARLEKKFNAVVDTLMNKHEQLNFLVMAFEQSPMSIIITDADGRIQYTNKKFTALTGYLFHEIKGKTPKIFRSGYTADEECSGLWNTVNSGQIWRGEYLNYKKSGEQFWERATVSSVVDSDGDIRYFIIIKEDVDELKFFDKNLKIETCHDSLTGLPGQKLFEEKVRLCLDRGNGFAIAVVNLDGFHKINISHTHAGGDQIIKGMAGRLKPFLREEDILARINADEFALLLPGKDAVSIQLLLEQMLEALRMPFPVGIEQAFLTGYAGVAFYPENGSNFTVLWRNVFSSLHRAKRAGGDKICFFQQSLDDQIIEVFALESELRQALEREEFELYYQPQIYDGQVCGAEALLRWSSRKYGMVAPDDFIPLAEQSGLIVEIGCWVLETACRQALCWPERIVVSVNISPRQFAEGNLVERVVSVLSETGLPAHRLELEATESLLQQDILSTVQDLEQLAAVGVRVALDDFGTGYSSLAYLSRLPLTALKLDRIFISEIVSCERSQNLCHAIVNMANTLGLRIVAEGVESHEQIELLKNWGVCWFQGYYYSPPVPIKSFLEML